MKKSQSEANNERYTSSCSSTYKNEDKSHLMPGVNAADVLLGRSRLALRHEGNDRFRRLVRAYMDEYRAIKKRKFKILVVKKILSIISDHGGRFLKCELDESGELVWIPLEPTHVREKVGQALRMAKPWKTKEKHDDERNFL